MFDSWDDLEFAKGGRSFGRGFLLRGLRKFIRIFVVKKFALDMRIIIYVFEILLI